MDQLEAKIETGRHNLKIQMDKEISVLQKQINLHVHDIERIQGFVANLANKKGKTRDELLRGKERSRKTMEQLKRSKAVAADQGSSSPSKTGTLMGTNAGTLNQAFVEGSPVDILLFGNKRSMNSYSTSFGQTGGSSETGFSSAQVVSGLKNMIKTSRITRFAISTVGPDGSRLYT